MVKMKRERYFPFRLVKTRSLNYFHSFGGGRKRSKISPFLVPRRRSDQVQIVRLANLGEIKRKCPTFLCDLI